MARSFVFMNASGILEPDQGEYIMNEEGNAILKMLEEGKISEEEAALLLDAIRQPERPSSVSQILADSLQPNVRDRLQKAPSARPDAEGIAPSAPKRGGARNGRGVGRKSGRSRDHGSGLGPHQTRDGSRGGQR